MPGQAPGTGWWQGQDGQWHPPQSYPKSAKTKVESKSDDKEPRAKSIREWIQTTQGVLTLLVSIAALGSGGAAIAVNSGSGHASTVSSQNSGSPMSTPSTPVNSGPVSTGQLTQALLPATALGPATSETGSGTDLSTQEGLCGEPLASGAQATAYESMQNTEDEQNLSETIIRWDSASDASNAIVGARNAIDQVGSCPISGNGTTMNVIAISGGLSPSACSSGQYVAVQGSSAQATSYIGYRVATSCGAYTVAIGIVGLTGVITQETADGYLTSAVAKLQGTIGS